MTATLRNVSDTALWVTYYRSLESQRSDALFKDPLASLLIDDRAQQIAASMPKTAPHTQQNVVMRTLIIDRFLVHLIREEKIDTILNLGAGLDTRPYRMGLPHDLRWIEVDYANLMEFKDQRLASHSPTCRIERISLDLSNEEQKQNIFRKISKKSKRVAVITEGVLPYLHENEVSTLSRDLQAQENFEYWIADYVSSDIYKYLRNDKRMEKMEQAPFRFFPPDYLSFYQTHHWKLEQLDFIQEEARKHGRELPPPAWVQQLPATAREKMRDEFLKSSGYLLLSRAQTNRK